MYSFKCVHLPDVSCSWLMVLHGHGEEEMEHHLTRMRCGPLWKGGFMCMFVCAMSHRYVPKGCTVYLFDVVLAIPSFAPTFSPLLPFPSSHLLSILPPLSNSSPPLLPSPPSLPSPTICPNAVGYNGYSLAYSVLYSVVVLLPHENGKQSGKHLWCERSISCFNPHTIHIYTHMMSSGTDIYGN